ncbi:MAG: hypothetical protein H6727_12165 [Myxococcales bacterium]|nr:hypothetical protein [Myxococcales bacterium]
MKKNRWFIVLLAFLGLGWPLSSTHAQSEAKTCGQLFKQQQTKLAGDCFAQLAERMPPLQKLDELQKRQKGIYLQNAAKAYANHAQSAERANEQTFFFEKASQLLHLYLNEKLCNKDYQCRSVQGLLYEYEQKIGYATLSLFDESGTSPQVELRGYRYERRFTFQKKHTEKLRPGTYTMRVTYANAEPISRIFTIGKGENRPEKLVASIARPRTPPVVQKKAPLGAWVVLVGGIVVVAGGAALLGVSLAMDGGVATRLSNSGSVANADETKAVGDEYNTALGLNTGGWVAIGAGAAIALGGVLWLVLAPKSSPAPPNKSAALSAPSHPAQQGKAHVLFVP